jgi:hypothetical protein
MFLGNRDTAEMRYEAVGEAQQLELLRAEIAARLGRGDCLESVEREVIVPSRLSDEQQSALWLYGWSLAKRPRRRAGCPCVESDTASRDLP